MKNLKEELTQFQEMLRTNAGADWSENDPKTEFSVLSEKLQKIINTIPSERQETCNRLEDFICEDEDRYATTEEALQLLEKQADIDGSVMADDIVLMWEKVEYEFTVDQLLEQINL